MGTERIVKNLTLRTYQSQFERYRAHARCLCLVGLCSLILGGCSACSDEKALPAEETTLPIVDVLPPSPTSPPVEQPPLPQACQVTDGLHLFSLQGKDLGAPTTPVTSTLSSHYVTHYGGPARAVAYAGKQMIWAQGSTLHSGDMAEDLKVVVNELGTYTDQGVTKLAVAHREGLLIIPLTITDTSVALGGNRMVVQTAGEVTHVRTVSSALPISAVEALPAEINISINAPPPGTTAATSPSALLFTTGKGAAYRLEGNCLTQLYDPTEHLQDGEPLKAVAIAGDARRAVILAESVVTQSEEKTQKAGAALQTFRETYPGMSREVAHGFVARLLHLGQEQSATQTLYHVDLVAQSVKAFWRTAPGTDDALLNDIAVADNHLYLQGLFFNRMLLADALAKEEDRWQLLARFTALLTGPAPGGMPAAIVGGLKSGVVIQDLQDLATAPIFVTFPAKPNASLAPFVGRMIADGTRLYFRGPFGYGVTTRHDGSEPMMIASEGSAAGYPLQIAVDLGGARLAHALGKNGLEELTLAGMTAQLSGTSDDPETLGVVHDDRIFFQDPDGTHHVMINRTTGERVEIPSYATQVAASPPTGMKTTVLRHLVETMTIDTDPYVIIAASNKAEIGEKSQYFFGGIEVYHANNLPAMTASPGEILATAQASTILNLNATNPQSDLFYDDKIKVGGDRWIADMRAAGPYLLFLLMAESAEKHDYRAVVYSLNHIDGKLSLQLVQKSPILEVKKTNGQGASITFYAVNPSSANFFEPMVADLNVPEGLLTFKAATTMYVPGIYTPLSNLAKVYDGRVLSTRRVTNINSVLVLPAEIRLTEQIEDPIVMYPLKEKVKITSKSATAHQASLVINGNQAIIASGTPLLESAVTLLDHLNTPAKATLSAPLSQDRLLHILRGASGEVVAATEDNGIAIYQFSPKVK